MQNFWISLPGLPQEIIIDLTDLLQYPLNGYQSFGLFCWHGYNTNPKLIELQISIGNNQTKEFQSLGLYELELKNGIQIIPIKYNDEIKNSINIKYIKIIIKENFGGEWTYINQIMLFDKDYKEINNALKDSIISFSKSAFIDNNEDDAIDFDNYEVSNKKDSLDSRNNIQGKGEIANEKNIQNNLLDNINNNIEKIGFEKNYVKKKLVTENKFQKDNKISKIEKLLKQNILENESNDGESISYYNTSNNMLYKNKTNNNLFDLSENKIFKNAFNKTPNRYITNQKETDNNNNKNISKRDKISTQNIDNINKHNNINKELAHLDSKDYDNILKTQLEDMENQIDLLNKMNIAENKDCYLKQKNSYVIKTYNLEKKEIQNLSNKNINESRNDLNILFNKKILNKTAFNNFYHKKNNIFEKNNNTINYKEKKTNIFKEDKNDNNNNNYRKKNTYFNTPQSNRNYYNIFERSKYNLNDLSSNNTIDINKRLDILEKNVFEIRKELYAITQVISVLISGDYIKNIIKENIKIINDEHKKEKKIIINYNNNDSNNQSFYNEILNEENNTKQYDNEINKIIEKSLNKLTEEIKIDIFDKYLYPSLNRIELKMEKSINEINNKINNIIKDNNFNESENIIYMHNIDENRRNKFSEIQSNSDLFNKNSAKLRDEKYEEINRLGEKLYEKLLEKEKKLKLLKKETAKFLEDN